MRNLENVELTQISGGYVSYNSNTGLVRLTEPNDMFALITKENNFVMFFRDEDGRVDAYTTISDEAQWIPCQYNLVCGVSSVYLLDNSFFGI